MGPNWGWLWGSARAQADARRLRSLYGQKAEAWCAYALAGLPLGDPRRRSVLRIVKALRGVPCQPAVGRGAETVAAWRSGPAVEPQGR